MPQSCKNTEPNTLRAVTIGAARKITRVGRSELLLEGFMPFLTDVHMETERLCLDVFRGGVAEIFNALSRLVADAIK